MHWKEPDRLNSADRLLAILQLFTAERCEWTVPSAAHKSGVSVPTAYRYFRSLCKCGLLDPFADGLYVLGPAIIEYDRQIRMVDPLIKIGKPIMQRLRPVLGPNNAVLGAITMALPHSDITPQLVASIQFLCKPQAVSSARA